MSRAESANILKDLLNDELCTLVACRQAMERVKEPATVAELSRIYTAHTDSISHLRAAIIDRAEEPEDDPKVCAPWDRMLRELGDSTQSDAVVGLFRKAEDLCRERVALAAARREGLDETARRMVSEVILPRHVANLTSLDQFRENRLKEPEIVADRAATEAADAEAGIAARAVTPPVKKAVSPALEVQEPDLKGAVSHFAAQLAKAGLMVGIFGVAMAMQPFRFVLRRGMGAFATT